MISNPQNFNFGPYLIFLCDKYYFNLQGSNKIVSLWHKTYPRTLTFSFKMNMLVSNESFFPFHYVFLKRSSCISIETMRVLFMQFWNSYIIISSCRHETSACPWEFAFRIWMLHLVNHSTQTIGQGKTCQLTCQCANNNLWFETLISGNTLTHYRLLCCFTIFFNQNISIYINQSITFIFTDKNFRNTLPKVLCHSPIPTGVLECSEKPSMWFAEDHFRSARHLALWVNSTKILQRGKWRVPRDRKYIQKKALQFSYT